MLVSVVIVNYNVCDLLLSAIESLHAALDGMASEIIVVDNRSSDGAIETVNRLYPDVVTVALDRNIGFGAANNVGFERATGEFILILNPDTIVQDDTVRVMLDFMELHPEATFVGCKIILPDGTLDPVSKRGFPSPWSSFCRVFGLSRLFPRSKVFGGYNLTYIGDDETAEIDALAGCFMFCRADALKQLGGFDTDYFMYGEDLDLCYRARQRGGVIYYHPATSIMHRKGESTRRSSVDALALFYEAMEIFARKHFRRNPLMLLLVRLGIKLRRTLARVVERFPGYGFAPVDVAAALCGFILGSIAKFGTPFNYPDWAVPVVWGLPPLLFVFFLAIAGGYSLDDRTPGKAFLGTLFGFFFLSTLTYFFKEYAFSRGVLLVTTSVVGGVGITVRFLRLLYRRIYGVEAIRRVAFLSRQPVGPRTRAAVKKIFSIRPVVVLGTIAPTFSEMGERTVGDSKLGSVDNIVPIVRDYQLTDIVVIDARLSYTEVLRAMELTANQQVRFHVMHGAAEETTSWMSPQEGPAGLISVPLRSPMRPVELGVRNRVLALVTLMVLWPVVYWASDSVKSFLKGVWGVIRGRRALVGSGASAMSGSEEPPLFAMTSFFKGEEPTRQELDQLDDFYRANRSLLLDCEIILTEVRGRSIPRVDGVEPLRSNSKQTSRAGV